MSIPKNRPKPLRGDVLEFGSERFGGIEVEDAVLKMQFEPHFTGQISLGSR